MPRRAQRFVALVLSCVVVVGPFAAGGVAQAAKFPCDVHGQITPHPTEWYSIRGPSFPAGSQVISGFAVEPLRPDYIYVTNGISVMRTTDSGCRWQESYTLPASGTVGGPTRSDSTIQEIELSGPGVVYLPIQQQGPAGPKPRVMVSKDAGASWASGEGGLFGGLSGRLLDLDAPLADASKAYALVNVENEVIADVSVDSAQMLLETDDAGATWTSRTIFDDGTTVDTGVVTVSSPFEGFQQITADPIRGEEVWLYGGNAPVMRMAAQESIPTSLRQIGVLDIAVDGSMIVAYDEAAPTGHVSIDGGESFETFQTGVTIESAAAITAVGSQPFGAAEGLGRSFYHLAMPGTLSMQTLEITPVNMTRVSGLRAGIREGGPNGLPFEPLVYGHTSNTIEVRGLPAIPTPPSDIPGEIIGDLTDPGVERPPGVLVPRHTKIKLRPGRAATVGYGLTVPPSSTPLDVYFLIDISGSMGGTIDGVRSAMQEIVNRLSDAGTDVNFGVGAFRAYGDPPAYARLRDIGPVNEDLRRALNSLSATGGGAETQMSALYQSVTGEGEPGIPPDLQMNFRPGSLRVAILATDEVISQGGAHKPVPVVIEALKKADVKQVGLAIQERPLLGDYNYENPGEPGGTLQRVAAGSGAVAPVGGVDCDGDGEADIAEGGPIVCLMSAGESSEADIMADAIVNVLNAVQDIQDVGIRIAPTDATVDGDIVESVTPDAFPATDLKERHDLGFLVTVRCPQVRERTSYPLEVNVGTERRTLGDADLIVVCDPKEKEEPAPPLAPPFVPLLAIPFPPVRPPEPIPEPNPNPQPNPQGNPQTQAGMASQEQKQPQLAAVHQEAGQMQLQPEKEEMGGDQFLMTAHEQSQGLQPGAVFVTGVVLMTMVYGFATMRREQIRTQHQRRKPWDQ